MSRRRHRTASRGLGAAAEHRHGGVDVPSFPEPWASVLLDELPSDAGALAARLACLGVQASTTSEGWLALPGGFLGLLAQAPYPHDLLVHPGALDVPERATAAVLHVSGGAHEGLLEEHARRTVLEQIAGGEPRKTARFEKLERLAALLAPLAPLGPGVVLPRTGHRFVPWSAWPPTRGAGEVFGLFVTLGRAGELVHTKGLSTFGVPELATSLGARADAEAAATATRDVFDVAFEVAWQGLVPDGTSTVVPFVDRAVAPRGVMRATHGSLWMGDPHDTAFAAWSLRDDARIVFGASPLFDDPDASTPGVHVAVYGGLAGPRRAMTVGLSRLSREAGPIEIVASSPRLSRHAAIALGELGELVRASPDRMHPYDRIAMGTLEPYGIAGVVLWPFGRLGAGERAVELWSALPITPEELARFRAGGQAAWMDEVEASNAFDAIDARWCTGTTTTHAPTP
jgi:hypothetical protein